MFNGHQEQYRCFSKTCQTDMTFGIYLPPQVLKGYPAPVLYFLSGLHGDGSELIRQTGIQRFAAQWNIIVVFPRHLAARQPYQRQRERIYRTGRGILH